MRAFGMGDRGSYLFLAVLKQQTAPLSTQQKEGCGLTPPSNLPPPTPTPPEIEKIRSLDLESRGYFRHIPIFLDDAT